MMSSEQAFAKLRACLGYAAYSPKTFGLGKITLSRNGILAIRSEMLKSATTGKLNTLIDRLHALWGNRQGHSPTYCVEMLITQLSIDPPNDRSAIGYEYSPPLRSICSTCRAAKKAALSPYSQMDMKMGTGVAVGRSGMPKSGLRMNYWKSGDVVRGKCISDIETNRCRAFRSVYANA
jgi:hypothetical protein